MTSEHVERAYRRYDIAKLLLLILAVILILAALSILLYNSATARAQRQKQIEVAQLLVECTTPPGDRKPPVKVTDEQADCYTRNLERQAQVLGDPAAPINDVSIIAAACGAAHPGDITATRACVLRGLRR